MRYFILYLTFSSLLLASFIDINSFEATFIQTIQDDKNKVLTYKGTVYASKPYNAVWKYLKPIAKDVYINRYSITIVEPEIEQVIIRNIESNFNFFNMLKNAKKIDENHFVTSYNDIDFKLEIRNDLLYSISYIDEFDNFVKIIFKKQIYNKVIDDNIYVPVFSTDFDVIRD